MNKEMLYLCNKNKNRAKTLEKFVQDNLFSLIIPAIQKQRMKLSINIPSRRFSALKDSISDSIFNY